MFDWCGLAIAAGALGAALGYLAGRLVFVNQLHGEGLKVVYDGSKRLGQGRYKVTKGGRGK